MKVALERSVRFAYDDALADPSGQLSPQTLARVAGALAPHGAALPVCAAWSAARAVVFPQLDPSHVPGARLAVVGVLERLATNPTSTEPVPALAAFQTASESLMGDGMAPRRISAARSVVSALACALAPSEAAFVACITALNEAQKDPAIRPASAQGQTIGWLDDVVVRSLRFSVPEVLTLLEAAIAGTILGLLPSQFLWEGTGDEAGRLETWTQDPRTRKLVMPVLVVAEPQLNQGVLSVTIASKPGLAKDRLRIEHLFEHEIHRVFLGSLYEGRYQYIDYQFEDGSAKAWRAPA